MSIPHIVMIEDNLPDVLVFREALARRGIAFTIEHYSDGEKASDAISQMTAVPDLFILDLNLPRVDGLALLRQIRERELTAHAKVAVLTTSHASEDRIRSEALGADAYVVKPGNFTEFMDMVGTAIQRLLSRSAAGAARVPAPPRGRPFRLTAILGRGRRRTRGKTRAAGLPD